MRTLVHPARFTALVSAVLLGIGSLTAMPAATAKASTQTLHFYEVGTGVTLLTAAGKVVPGGLNSQPKPGQLFDMVANLYHGSHAKHGSKVVGTDHLLCTFTKTMNTICDAQAALGGSMIIATSRGGTQDDFPVIEGTGRFSGWVGISHHRPVTDATADLTMVLHRAVS